MIGCLPDIVGILKLTFHSYLSKSSRHLYESGWCLKSRVCSLNLYYLLFESCDSQNPDKVSGISRLRLDCPRRRPKTRLRQTKLRTRQSLSKLGLETSEIEGCMEVGLVDTLRALRGLWGGGDEDSRGHTSAGTNSTGVPMGTGSASEQMASCCILYHALRVDRPQEAVKIPVMSWATVVGCICVL